MISNFDASTPAPSPAIDRSLVLVMATATGSAIANLYYNQPILGLIDLDLRAGRLVGMVPTATQVGYAVGIVLLVPLGDQFDRRRLILLECIGLTVTLLMAAVAPTVGCLIAASALIGVFATIAQQIVPFAAELARPSSRGRTVGAVMSGLLVGILAARILGGAIGQAYGWRVVFWMAACLALLMTALLAARLPHSRPAPRQPYLRLLSSLWHLTRREPELRRAALTQGLLFAGFSAFWTILALLFREPGFDLDSSAAGLFGFLALGGVAVAPLAGRIADVRGPRGLVKLGVAAVLAAFVIMGGHVGIATIAIGVVLMDAGVQMAMIANQAIIYSLAGEARGRFNTVFIAVMFALGATGSATSSIAWDRGGWMAVMALAASFAAIALLVQAGGRRAPSWQGPEPSP